MSHRFKLGAGRGNRFWLQRGGSDLASSLGCKSQRRNISRVIRGENGVRVPFPFQIWIGNKGSQRLARPSRDIGLVWFWVVRFFFGGFFGRCCVREKQASETIFEVKDN